MQLDHNHKSCDCSHVTDVMQVWQASRHTPEQNKQAIVDFCWLRKDFAQLLGGSDIFHLHEHQVAKKSRCYMETQACLQQMVSENAVRT